MSGLDALKKKVARPTPTLRQDADGGGGGGGESKNGSAVPGLKTPGAAGKGRSERVKALLARRKGPGASAGGRTPGSPTRTPGGAARARALERAQRDADKPAEVHFVGELSGCSGFGSGVSCRWTLDFDEAWSLASEAEAEQLEDQEDEDEDEEHAAQKTENAAGAEKQADGGDGGADNDAKTATTKKKRRIARRLTEQTHYAYGTAYGEPVWAHPLEFHCKSRYLGGWPRLLLEVFKLDEHGRSDIAGYGVVDLPKSAGAHELEITTWRPKGTPQQERAGTFCVCVCGRVGSGDRGGSVVCVLSFAGVFVPHVAPHVDFFSSVFFPAPIHCAQRISLAATRVSPSRGWKCCTGTRGSRGAG